MTVSGPFFVRSSGCERGRMTATALPVVTASSCLGCGACCVEDHEYFPSGYAHLSRDDYERIPHPLRNLLVTADGSYMRAQWRTHGGVSRFTCAALKGTVGVDARCSIYDDRPRVCRWFKPGETMCLDARREASL